MRYELTTELDGIKEIEIVEVTEVNDVGAPNYLAAFPESLVNKIVYEHLANFAGQPYKHVTLTIRVCQESSALTDGHPASRYADNPPPRSRKT